MINDPNCTLCSLSSTCKSPCIEGIGDKKASLMIVAEAPGVAEDTNDKAFFSKKDKVLFNIIKDAMNVDPDSIYMTYLSKCTPEENKKATDKEIKTCYTNYLLKEIELVNPKVILTLGEVPFNYLSGKKSVVKNHGELYTVTLNDNLYTLIPTFAPGYIAYNENKLMDFAQDIDKAYELSSGIQKEKKETKLVWVKDEDTMHELCDYIEWAGKCCFDFETNELNAYKDTFFPTLLSVSFQPGSGYAIPLKHHENTLTEKEYRNLISIFNDRVLQNHKINKINQNLKFDLHCLTWFGIKSIQGKLDDTMLMHHLLDETSPHGLKEMIMTPFPEYYGYEKELEKFGNDWGKRPLEPLAKYGVTDTDLTLRLSILFEARLIQDLVVYRLYRNLVMPALRVLFYAERDGMKIDVDFLEKAIDETTEIAEEQLKKVLNIKAVRNFMAAKEEETIQQAIKELEEKKQSILDKQKEDFLQVEQGVKKTPSKTFVTQLQKVEDKITDIKLGKVKAYEGLNLGSPKQLTELLYGPLGFKFKPPYNRKKKETGGTGKDVLIELKDRSGFVDGLLLYRSIVKTLGTYMEGIYKLIDGKHRIHTVFKQHGTVSGRLSSADPNLQNLPKGSKLNDPISKEVVAKVKQMFIPTEGCYMLQVDYSQAELRIAASFANDETMLTAYNNDEDLHTLTAREANSLTVEQWAELPKDQAKTMRNNAKPVNFGFLYGMSAEGFVDYAKSNYGVTFSIEEARKFRNKYFNTYSNLLTWHTDYVMRAQTSGFVRTLFGRKRHTPMINSLDDYMRAEDERVAVNSPVQGTAGEFTIFALTLLHQRLNKRVKLANTVHDSIIYYVPVDLFEETVQIVKETCENLPTEKYFRASLKNVSMKVDLEYSKDSWRELKPVEL